MSSSSNNQLGLRAWARIDLRALQANLDTVRRLCPHASIVPVIKSNGYGHGMAAVAAAIKTSNTEVAALAVASLDEALQLKQIDADTPILLLAGFVNENELLLLTNAGISFVLHSLAQLKILKRLLASKKLKRKLKVWIKLDSGMHRLGLTQADCFLAFRELHANECIEQLTLMSHLSCADSALDERSLNFSNGQITLFNDSLQKLKSQHDLEFPASLAASGAILTLENSLYQIVRPGIMLYGGSPLTGKNGMQLGLKPVMTLCSRIIALQNFPAGDFIGYGASYCCEKNLKVAVVSIGYGDGYPRSAASGTPVMVKSGDELVRCRLLGRVSMDMISIDVSDLPTCNVGDEVILWGQGLSADEVASHADTISYELFCQITARVSRIYL